MKPYRAEEYKRRKYFRHWTARVWRYNRGNQNPYIEEKQTTYWQKEKGQKDKQRSTKYTTIQCFNQKPSLKGYNPQEHMTHLATLTIKAKVNIIIAKVIRAKLSL